MTPRLRRIAADYEQIKKDFTGHAYIVVAPAGGDPPEKYNVTYFVNGIYLLPDGRVQTIARHDVEITLHSEYPRYKPICKIKSPIWHPNFRDGQICIGDIWGAGESLSDIIINIGDMIQYKSWNSSSPLSADAAQWAIDNKHLFPVGNIELNKADYAAVVSDVEIDLFDDDADIFGDDEAPAVPEPEEDTNIFNEDETLAVPEPEPEVKIAPEPEVYKAPEKENDFDITAEELIGIEFVPTEQRMQTFVRGRIQGGGKINFKTILVKGILWAFIGAVIGFGVSELVGNATESAEIMKWMGYEDFAAVYEIWQDYLITGDEELYDEFEESMGLLPYTEDKLNSILTWATLLSSAIFSALIALGLGLFLGIGEGIFYGSVEKTIKYALIGAGIAIALGFLSGLIAQGLYSALSNPYGFGLINAFARALGWAIMGLGVGLAIGLIKPAGKRILFCSLGGFLGGFIGGFIFDFIPTGGAQDTGTVSRAVGIVIMGLLIGLGIGLLEQFAKAAWLKVVRGEFEGKEYLVFTGTTSIGNNGKNTIVLFKDRLVGPHHCDIVLEGSKYYIVDSGTPTGTIVNGMRVAKQALRNGDSISIGNSVLMFNSK